MALLFRGGTLLPCSLDPEGEVVPAVRADLLVEGGRIAALLPPGQPPPPDAELVDVSGRWILPGLVQIHIHLVQTLFRGLADDLALLDWLRTRIWPLERAHDADSVYWSARLGLTELLLGGTTAILDMGTVGHTDEVFRAAEEVGMRAFIGKAQMDLDNEAGLGESTEDSLRDAVRLRDRWHGQGRLRYAFAPRFVPSCSERLLRATVAAAREAGCLLHTHASENTDEVALVRRLTGMDNVRYLDRLGFTGRDVVLAHCIHLTPEEERILAETGTVIAHCPSSNLKLASGVARVPELLAAGVRCGIGADGAPCNNRLDAWTELRTASLMQKVRLGAAAMPAPLTLGLATRRGAEALGLDTGALEPGRPADLVILEPDAPYAFGGGDPRAAAVFSHGPASVCEVWIEGERVVRDGVVRGWDTGETIAGARQALERVRRRAGL